MSKVTEVFPNQGCMTYFHCIMLISFWVVTYYVYLQCITICLFVSVLHPIPHLLSLANNVKLGKYSVPTGNQTPGHCVAVHYATAAPRKLHSMYYYVTM